MIKIKVTDEYGTEYCTRCYKNGILSMNRDHENHGDKIKDCEKCGGETATKLVGDESYDYCVDCNWVTN